MKKPRRKRKEVVSPNVSRTVGAHAVTGAAHPKHAERRKRKPLVVWGVVRKEMPGRLVEKVKAGYRTKKEAQNHFGPGLWKYHRVVKFVEEVR